jgi:hypothetical protein
VTQGLDKNDFYVGSRVVDGSGVPRFYLSLHKYLLKDIFVTILFGSTRIWSSSLPTHNHIPLKHSVYKVDDANSYYFGYAQDPMDRSEVLFYYIP